MYLYFPDTGVHVRNFTCFPVIIRFVENKGFILLCPSKLFLESSAKTAHTRSVQIKYCRRLTWKRKGQLVNLKYQVNLLKTASSA
jgi:hypothetical protein